MLYKFPNKRTRFSPFLICFSRKSVIQDWFCVMIKQRSYNIDIQDLNISATSKSALKSIGFTTISQLEGQNYITLINRFPQNFNIDPLIHELNSLGYRLPPPNETSIYDTPMSKRLQNALLRNGVMYLSQGLSVNRQPLAISKSGRKNSYRTGTYLPSA